MDTIKRSWLKAVLWNLLGLISLAMVGLAVTGSLFMGGALAVINTAIGFSPYLAYERLWARIS